MSMSQNQKVGQNHNIQIANKSSENVAKLNILNDSIKNCIHNEDKEQITFLKYLPSYT
jgi:hypothetical protein